MRKRPLLGWSYGGELAGLGGLARQGEMIFIPRSYGIFYLSSIKKFVQKKICHYAEQMDLYHLINI